MDDKEYEEDGIVEGMSKCGAIYSIYFLQNNLPVYEIQLCQTVLYSTSSFVYILSKMMNWSISGAGYFGGLGQSG